MHRERVTAERVRAPSGMGYSQFISHSQLIDSDTSVQYISNDDCVCFRVVSVDLQVD